MKEDIQKFIEVVGSEWAKPEILEVLKESKYYNRVEYLIKKFEFVDKYLPEYKIGNRTVLDVSCASGALLEVFRYFNNIIHGTDVQYFQFLCSQDIPYDYMNCTEFPYLFKDNSVDLITCIGAITFYFPFKWKEVMNEFARIARQTIFIIVNKGKNLDEFGYLLNEWEHKDWKLVLNKDTHYKWEHK